MAASNSAVGLRGEPPGKGGLGGARTWAVQVASSLAVMEILLLPIWVSVRIFAAMSSETGRMMLK